MMSRPLSLHPIEVESKILKLVVRNLKLLEVRQHLLPQETLLQVARKIGCKNDPIYMSRASQSALGPGFEKYFVTCTLDAHQVTGESCDESRGKELAACSMLVRVLIKLNLDLDDETLRPENSQTSPHGFRYMKPGFRLDSRLTFKSIEQLRLPLDKKPQNVTKICYRPIMQPQRKYENLSTKEFKSKYELRGRIEAGSFSLVMMGTQLKTNLDVAMKFESLFCKHTKLIYEAEATRRLSQGGAPVPPVLDFFSYKRHLVLVMPFKGPNLEIMFERFPFSAETVGKLAYQMINCIQSVHALGFIHRDVKPGSFLLGYDQKLWITNFEMSKPFGSDDKAKIYCSGNPRVKLEDLLFYRIGTRRYCTLRSHMGKDQNFQDDLIAMGYTLAYFLLRGRLPWKGLKTVAVEAMKRKMEGTYYSGLYKDLPHPGKEWLGLYFQLILESSGDSFVPSSYEHLQSIFQSTQNTPGHLFEWKSVSSLSFQSRDYREA